MPKLKSARWFKRITLALLATLSVLYLTVAVSVLVFQRNLEYFPSHRDVEGVGDGMFAPFKNDEGKFLGYFRPATESAERVFLFFHGNSGEALHREWITQIASPSTAIVLAEYPGFGAREGVATQTSILKAAEEIYDETVKRFPRLPVIAMGHSLGTGVASYLTSVKKVDRLALIAPFTSAADVGAERYPFLPVRWMMFDTFDSEVFLKSVHVPLHIIHGGRDTTVPFAYGKMLFEGYDGGPKEFTAIPQAGHNDITFTIVHSADAKNFRAFLEPELGVQHSQLEQKPAHK